MRLDPAQSKTRLRRMWGLSLNRRHVAYLAALVLGTSLSTGAAFAQYYPPGSQIYRDGPAPGYRGLPPSWLVDEEDQPLPPPGYRPNGQPLAPSGPQQYAVPAPGHQQ